MIHRWLRRPHALGVVALLTFACILLYQLPASPAASTHFIVFTGSAPFDERPAGYTLSRVLLDFHRLGPEGIADYRAYRLVDFVFPWLLCALVAGVMLRLDAARATLWPWLAAAVDTGENIALWIVLQTRADPAPETVQLASLLTQAKFAAYAVMLLMLLAVGVRYLWRERGPRR